jgi:hypothetical protein
MQKNANKKNFSEKYNLSEGVSAEPHEDIV